MNNLNNHQLVLLTLLVSFVTSIATGIFTVTLLDQAPPAVTSTINRVVERTIETVVPTEKETLVKERVIVDKGGELIVSAIQKTSPAIIYVYSNEEGVEETEDGGSLKSKKGLGFFVKDKNIFISFMEKPSKDLFIILKDIEYYLDYAATNEMLGLTLFTLRKDEEGNVPDVVFPELALLEEDVQVGQTAIVVNSGTVAVSFVSGLVKDEKKDPYYKLYLDETDALLGAPVVNIEEKVIGILRADGELISSNVINYFIEEATKTDVESTEENTQKVDA